LADPISGDGYKIYGWDVEFADGDNAAEVVTRVENAVRNNTTVKEGKVIVLTHDRYFRESQNTGVTRLLGDHPVFESQ